MKNWFFVVLSYGSIVSYVTAVLANQVIRFLIVAGRITLSYWMAQGTQAVDGATYFVQGMKTLTNTVSVGCFTEDALAAFDFVNAL